MAGRGGVHWQGGDPAAAARALEQAQGDVREALVDVVQGVPGALRKTFPDAARRKMPRRGGLADIVAGADLAAVEDTAGDVVGVTVTASGKVDLAALNRGELRHPVHGSRQWTLQRVPPGMWDEACDDAAQGTDDELLQGLREVARTTAQRSRGS